MFLLIVKDDFDEKIGALEGAEQLQNQGYCFYSIKQGVITQQRLLSTFSILLRQENLL
jgi:hypothetical protein